jgi:nicotinamidase/pyrazinamidase
MPSQTETFSSAGAGVLEVHDIPYAPDMVIGADVDLKGEISFERFIRVEGTFEGVLTCDNGCVYVGPTGKVIANLIGCDIVIIEGSVKGNIQAEHLIIRGDALIEGNIEGQSVEMGPHAQLDGQMKVHSKGKSLGSPTRPVSERGHTVLLIMDPQTDFMPNGAMGIYGADEDSERLAKFIRKEKENLDEVFVSMASHHRMHIKHGVFWMDSDGNSPEPFTDILNKDIENGKWRPRDEASDILEYVKYYTKELEARGKLKLTIWPEHCLIGSPGHAIVPIVNDALQEWATGKLNTVTYMMKGTNCLTEMYSALSAEVEIASDPSTQLDMAMVSRLTSGDRLIVCGQSSSHTVNYTVRDIVRHIEPNTAARIVVVEDGSSPLKGYAAQYEEFKRDMMSEGLTFCTFRDLNIS